MYTHIMAIGLLAISSQAHSEPLRISISPAPVDISFSPEEIECLALNIYFESRGEIEPGQEAVAWVTLNRVHDRHYPDTICDVVWDDNQFSWTDDGKSDVPAQGLPWMRAKGLAQMTAVLYENGHDDPTNGSLMFHATYVDPYWTSSYEEVGTIGSHVFYRRDT